MSINLSQFKQDIPSKKEYTQKINSKNPLACVISDVVTDSSKSDAMIMIMM